MHNITKEITDALKQFADRLPSTEQKERAPRTGAELTKVYGDKLGKLKPTQRYYIGDATCAVNHLKRLTRAYEAGGMPAVVKYLQPFEEFLHTPATETDRTDKTDTQSDTAEQPRAAEGFPEGRLEMNANCVGCPASCTDPNACAGPLASLEKEAEQLQAEMGRHPMGSPEGMRLQTQFAALATQIKEVKEAINSTAYAN